MAQFKITKTGFQGNVQGTASYALEVSGAIGSYPIGESGSAVDVLPFVSYTAQTLTSEQKAQAISNLSLSDSYQEKLISGTNIKTVNNQSVLGSGNIEVQDTISDLATIRSGAALGATAYQKPSTGIPSTDMSSAVQTSLSKADSALQSHQDISGKEDKSNKVTSMTASSTDDQYPSAKCVYDVITENEAAIAEHITSLTTNKEDKSNKVTSLSSDSTDIQYPSAKCVYDNLGNKVDKVSGKGLSTNDYTTAEKTKLAGLENYDDTSVTNRLTAIEDKIPTEATTENKLADKNYVDQSIATAAATFRGTVTAVNDTETAAQEALATISTKDKNDYANVLVENVPQEGTNKYKRYTYSGTAWVFNFAINSTGFTTAQWAALNSGATAENIASIAGKQDIISDLATIRSGAALGATAIQEHQSLAAYRTSAAQDVIDAGKASSVHTHTKSEITDFPESMPASDVYAWAKAETKPTYTYAEVGAAAEVHNHDERYYTETEIDTKLAAKQDTISDLSTIRSGAALGATAYQKPADGIPSTDMTTAVKNSLALADSALQSHQDISGKEDKSNKVTSLSSSSTDTQYPSAKCVYTGLSGKQATISDLETIRSGAALGATSIQSHQDIKTVPITIGTHTLTLLDWMSKLNGLIHWQHNVGDIAYWNGTEIAFVPYTAWTSSLGTPIGVCYIPTSHAVAWGDGKARFISVSGVNADGSAASSEVSLAWDSNAADAGLTKYTKVPTWDNTIGGTIGSAGYGLISSDKLTDGTQNVIDGGSKYGDSTPFIPSPYAADGSFYPDYIRSIEGYNNALSDFNGKTNTSIIVSLLGSTGGEAAKACSLYSTSGTSAGDWYLPACGELAYIMPRFNVINSALTACSGVLILGDNKYWSSTESSSVYAYFVYTEFSFMFDCDKDYSSYVRASLSLS